MKSEKPKRAYQMTKRAEAAVQTERNILNAVVELWKEGPISAITLDAVSQKAGVTVRTILRKYQSKEGLFEACFEADAGDIVSTRDQAPVGDIRGILQNLFLDYEEFGDANVRTHALEAEYDFGRKFIESGRAYHRTWCKKVFAPLLPESSDPSYENKLVAVITATDVFTWKLIRRDQQKSYEETLEIMEWMVTSILNYKTS